MKKSILGRWSEAVVQTNWQTIEDEMNKTTATGFATSPERSRGTSVEAENVVVSHEGNIPDGGRAQEESDQSIGGSDQDQSDGHEEENLTRNEGEENSLRDDFDVAIWAKIKTADPTRAGQPLERPFIKRCDEFFRPPQKSADLSKGLKGCQFVDDKNMNVLRGIRAMKGPGKRLLFSVQFEGQDVWHWVDFAILIKLKPEWIFIDWIRGAFIWGRQLRPTMIKGARASEMSHNLNSILQPIMKDFDEIKLMRERKYNREKQRARREKSRKERLRGENKYDDRV